MDVRPRFHSLDIDIIILVRFVIVCLCFTNNSQLAIRNMQKKNTSESGRSDYVISFVLSLIVSGGI